MERAPVKDAILINDDMRLKNIERQESISSLNKYYRSANFFQFPQDEELKYNKRAM